MATPTVFVLALRALDLNIAWLLNQDLSAREWVDIVEVRSILDRVGEASTTLTKAQVATMWLLHELLRDVKSGKADIDDTLSYTPY